MSVEALIISNSEEMNPLHRSTMEDVHIILEAGTWGIENDISLGSTKAKSPFDDLTYLGVYDGHGGRNTVDFLAQALHKNVAMELLEKDVPIPTRLERAFLLTDIQSNQYQSSGGSTVALCLIQKPKSPTAVIRLYTANVGDARVVLSRNRQAIRLSHDHSATDPSEVDRIVRAGGFCLKGRAMGVLAISRSMGDHGLKQYIIATPHTNTYDSELKPGRDFIILACDGLWDVLTDQDAVDIVLSWRGAKDDVAKELTRLALQKGTLDNIT
eukprot:CAMPEP_0194232436 /NCGR_PEP_ID=MMETSP0158-20130606/806_1 /TAXON_ID=33649 /ORGANISM="Thalassionema nitzschioides, Strain L26-B" /LENGTH=269 /DNA_ID=CAMNT_0038965193 /DNA_START=116 /DNA_END=921 /DNA_ORIENTATION=-